MSHGCVAFIWTVVERYTTKTPLNENGTRFGLAKSVVLFVVELDLVSRRRFHSKSVGFIVELARTSIPQ